jgi:hypothetical protein
MSRASWGGQQDLSGLFSSLINENFQQIKAGVNEALGKAQDEQSAKDQQMQAKWTAGKISDERWLDYIRSRIADSTDPQERSQWQQILLQNQDAISDAQWETKFQQNKITVGELINHYRQRMNGVRHDSPAYREIVNRNAELLRFQASGGSYYRDQFGGSGGGSGSRSGSSSGGSGSGGGGNSGGLQGLINKGLRGGPIDAGYTGGDVYNDRGPNLVGVSFGRPATSSQASLYATVIDGLLGSQKTLYQFLTFVRDNPDATSFTPPGSGTIIPINRKTVKMAADQYLRVTYTASSVYERKGDRSEAAYQRTLVGDMVTDVMPDINLRLAQPDLNQLGDWVKAKWAELDAAPTPEARARIAAEVQAHIQRWTEKHYPQTKGAHEVVGGFAGGQATVTGYNPGKNQPTENVLPPEYYQSLGGIWTAADIISHPENYTAEEVSAAYDSLRDAPDIGSVRVYELWGGGGTNGTLPPNARGSGDFREEWEGLAWSEAILKGDASPNQVPPGVKLYAYVYNPNTGRTEPSLALAQGNADGSFDIVPAQVDTNGNMVAAPNTASYMSNMAGKNVKVYTPLNNNAPASGYVYRFTEKTTVKGVTYAAGDLVPSDVLSGIGDGMFGVNDWVQKGKIAKSAPPGIAQASINGKTWFYDSRTNMWYASNPWAVEMDGTDKGALKVSMPKTVPNSNGVGATVDPNNPATPVMNMTPGASGFILPWDTSTMSNKQMQEWLDAGIASGEINIGEYKWVNADGEVVTLTADEAASIYYDPAISQRAQVMQQTNAARLGSLVGAVSQPLAGQEDAATIQAAKQDIALRMWQRNNSAPQAQPLPQIQTPDTDARMRSLEQHAFNLGIQTGVLPSNTPRTQPPDRRVNDSLLRLAALTAAQNRNRLAREPRLEPLPPNPKPPKPSVNPLHEGALNKPKPVDLVGVSASRKRNRKQEQVFRDTKASQMAARGIF